MIWRKKKLKKTINKIYFKKKNEEFEKRILELERNQEKIIAFIGLSRQENEKIANSK